MSDSEVEQQEQNQGDETPNVEGPGRLLREAREKAELSIADVSGRLHLEERILSAIESDDYENLPSATYARGYLRSYSKLLNVDAEHVIDLYGADAPEPPEIHPEVKRPSQLSSNDKPVKAFTYLITLSLFLLLLIWIQSNYTKDLPIDTADIGLEKKDAVAPAFDYEYKVVEHGNDWKNTESTEKVVNTDKANTKTSEVEPTVTEEAIATNVEVDTVVADESEASSETEATTEQAGVESPLDTSNSFIPPRAQNGPDNLVIKVGFDSWMEVNDAKNGRIYTDLVKANRTVLLKGTAPFSVLLGNGQNAKVAFNNEMYYQDSFEIKGVSRFKLGE